MAQEFPSSWARVNLRLERGPFSFSGHQYLREIYEEHHPMTVIEKASQMGISTFALAKAIWACETRKMKVIYFFPTDADVRDFSQDRFNGLVGNSPGLRSLMKTKGTRGGLVDNVGLKHIGDGTLYFRGLFHPGGTRQGQSGSRIKSVDADFLIFDELDEGQQTQREAALHRIDHSAHRWILELSTPTIPDYGIDREFQKSDQRFWMLRCPACGSYNCVEDEFPRCLERTDNGGAILACTRCRGPLDISQGRWVPKFPRRKERRGYHISQLYSPFVSLGDLLNEYEDPGVDSSLFYNHRLGLPYLNSADSLSAEDVLVCCRSDRFNADQKGSCFMGVDQGRLLHVVVMALCPSGKNRLIHACTVDEFDELDHLMERFDVQSCVIDALPNQHSARSFSRRYDKRVFCCYYNSHQREEARWTFESEGGGRVEVNRTQSLDATFRMIKKQELILPSRDPLMDEIAGHFKNIVRTSALDPSTGQVVFRYVRTGDDHYAHAVNYCRIAQMKLKDQTVFRARIGSSRPRWNGLI